jgi:signal peptidase II
LRHPWSVFWSRPLAIMVAVAGLIVIADQWSKAWAAGLLGPGGERQVIDVIPRVLRFIYVENTGAAFGMFRGSSAVLLMLSVVVVAVLMVLFYSMIVKSKLLGLAFGLQFGGAFGNMIDRFRLGYVVDFVATPWIPTFNVADSAITVGVVLLGVVLLMHPMLEPARKVENPASGTDYPRRNSEPVVLEGDRD